MRASSIAALLLVVGPAAAEPEPDLGVLAETLFREGRALLEAGKPNQACPKLADSYRLDPRLGTLMNVAACHEMEGRVATAWAEFLEAARRARARATADATKLEATARSRATALEPKLHRVEIFVDGATSDLALSLDGKELPPSAWSTPFPADPGHHELEVRRGDGPPMRQSFDLPTGPGKTSVRVAAEAKPAPAQAAVPVTPPTPASAPLPQLESPSPAANRSRLTSPVFLAAAGASLVASGLGTAFGLRAIAAKGDRDRECTPGGCSPAGLDRQSAAVDAARASTISFVVAGVALAIAVGALVWPDRAKPTF